MPSWNPRQYLQFADQRTQPCRDLVSRIALARVRRAIDLGCGPANSTRLLARRWPDAQVTGLDSSPAMIAAARRARAADRLVERDIAHWAAGEAERYDLVFSNAALQWVPRHASLFPRLLAHVARGGALAAQVPAKGRSPAHRIERELAASPRWRRWFPKGRVPTWNTHNLDFYYDALSPHAKRVDLWETEYLHVMPGPESIVEWYRATGLRPYLEAIGNEPERRRFLADYLALLRPAYPPRPDGRVLFPFRRLFLVAYR